MKTFALGKIANTINLPIIPDGFAIRVASCKVQYTYNIVIFVEYATFFKAFARS